jgi:hypothetical protein
MNRDFTVIFSYNLNGYSFLNIRILGNPFLKILLMRIQQIQKKQKILYCSNPRRKKYSKNFSVTFLYYLYPGVLTCRSYSSTYFLYSVSTRIDKLSFLLTFVRWLMLTHHILSSSSFTYFCVFFLHSPFIYAQLETSRFFFADKHHKVILKRTRLYFIWIFSYVGILFFLSKSNEKK